MNYGAALNIAYPLRDTIASDTNRYLRYQDEMEQKQAAIDALADTLYATEYSPFLAENVEEALGNLNQDKLAELSLAIQTKAHSATGQMIRSICCEYWSLQARTKAKAEVEASWR